MSPKRRRTGAVMVATLTVGLLGLLGVVATSAASASTTKARTRAATTADGVDDWTHGAHDLLASVPTSFRATCTISAASADDRIQADVLAARLAKVHCKPSSGADHVTYTRFDSVENADAYVEQLLGTAELDTASDDIADCPSHTTIAHGDADTTTGRYYCALTTGDDFLADGTPVITWTYEPKAIVAQAWDADPDLDGLRKFWADTAGPLATADKSGIPPLPTTASLRAGGKKLLAALPAASKAKCQIVDSVDEDALQSLYAWRLWIVADIEECRPTRGSTDSEYLKFANVGSLDDYYAAVFPTDDSLADERIDVGGSSCAGSGTYSVGKRKNVGSYYCYYSAADTDANDTSSEFAHVGWTVDSERIFGSGGAPATGAKALLRWWQEDAGPIRSS